MDIGREKVEEKQNESNKKKLWEGFVRKEEFLSSMKEKYSLDENLAFLITYATTLLADSDCSLHCIEHIFFDAIEMVNGLRNDKVTISQTNLVCDRCGKPARCLVADNNEEDIVKTFCDECFKELTDRTKRREKDGD